MGEGKRLRAAVGAALAGTALFLSALPVSAEETVRVGYVPLEGYHALDEFGNVTGYLADYLDRIAETTGWRYEYVEAGGWLEAQRMLEEGEVDMIAPPEGVGDGPAKGLEASSSRIAKTYGVIMAPADRTLFEYEDFERFDGMTVGVRRGSVYVENLAEYARYHEFQVRVVEYPSYAALSRAIESGKVDAAAANIMQVTEQMQILGKFNTSSVYFVFHRGDARLEQSLNEALYRIDREFPDFQNELMAEYFPLYNLQLQTKAEREYVEAARTIRVGCPVNMDPICYLDEKTGEIAGITRDILDRVSENSGLALEYVALPEGDITYGFLRENQIDIVSCVEYHSLNAGSEGMRLTNPYLVSRKVMVGRRGESYGKEETLKIGMEEGSQTWEKVIKAYYPNFEVVKYRNVAACMDALVEDDIDVLLQNQYTTDRFLARPKYENLAVVPMEGFEDSQTLSIILMQDGQGKTDSFLEDRRLLSVLNKAIANIPADTVSQIVISQTGKRAYRFRFDDLLYRYRYALAPGLFVLAVGAGIGAYAVYLHRKNVKLSYQSDYKLRTIANNINGGVVVLEPGETLHISYVNEGFLNLAGYTKEEFDKPGSRDFFAYVNEEDWDRVKEVAYADYGEPTQISMRLRLMCKDGEVVPAVFNGTGAVDGDGSVRLYCVILDMSGEEEMLEKLRLEQSKYSMIMEKADEILYEIDAVTGGIHMSDAFQKKFGWKFPEELEMLNMEQVLDQWRVMPEDRAKLQELFEISMFMSEDASCVVRIKDRQGSYRWCEVNQYVMTDHRNRPLLYLGKIADVDEEVREKAKLKAKSMIDSLTGLYNKDAFIKESAEYLRENRDSHCAVIFMDLDNFKGVNDMLGHMEGDRAIKDAAKKLQVIFCNCDIIARFGGDEFCVFVKDIPLETLEDKLRWTAEKMRHVYTDGRHRVQVSASLGAACTAGDGADLPELLLRADKALYHVKENGKGNYFIFRKKAE